MKEKGDGIARRELEPKGLSEISFVPNRKKVRRTRLLELVRFFEGANKAAGRKEEEDEGDGAEGGGLDE